MDPDFIPVLEVLAKFVAATSAYAYLLYRGGVRRGPAVAVSLAHASVLFCLFPVAREGTVAATLALGTCTYAVLAVDSPSFSAGIVVVVVIAFFVCLVRFGGGPLEAVVLMIPTALWVGAAIASRNWARGHSER
jgi:hypothetical protein